MMRTERTGVFCDAVTAEEVVSARVLKFASLWEDYVLLAELPFLSRLTSFNIEFCVVFCDVGALNVQRLVRRSSDLRVFWSSDSETCFYRGSRQNT